MTKRNKRKWLCGLTAFLCVSAAAIPVMADTVWFDITIPGDIISKRVVKADDEQRFYVTGVKFNMKNGTLKCTSSRLHTTVTSEIAEISADAPANDEKYKSYAAPRYDYYMHCQNSTNGLHVEGRYTP